MPKPLTLSAQVLVRMSEEMRTRLTEEADRQERTEAQIVRLALRAYFDAPDMAA